eukprot:1154329-Pelagomonas_calceolata.AAC.4
MCAAGLQSPAWIHRLFNSSFLGSDRLYMQEQCAACARNALFTALSIRAYGKGVRLPNFGIIHIMHSTNKMAN